MDVSRQLLSHGVDDHPGGTVFGQFVLVLDEGNGAAQVFARGRGPVRTVVVGVVDEVEGDVGGIET